MEKELKTRIEKEREEEIKLWNAINENHKRAYERRLLQQQATKIKKEKQAKKERRLNIATIVVMLLMMITIILLSVYAFKNYNDVADKCDAEKGYMCSAYEVRQYAIRGE